MVDFAVTQWETRRDSERPATERERERLSRDLHDLVGRDLVALAAGQGRRAAATIDVRAWGPPYQNRQPRS
ncbi:histidine kinase [Microtetraspora niveoalba]|uniref:histidine kinase n=1 Tax=Microtetraspora niveoalba TaxID=46175 RepID=UPI0008347D62